MKDPQQNSYEGIQDKYPEWFEGDKVVYPYNLDLEEMQKAESYQERTNLINLPVEIAEKTNTEILFSLAEEYSLMDFSLYDSTESLLKITGLYRMHMKSCCKGRIHRMLLWICWRNI